MPRALVIGNGNVLATFDGTLQLRDLYFPFVGMEDHTAYGDVHRTGVWVEGRGFAWFSDTAWEREIRYKHETLVGNSRLVHRGLGIEITAEDYVHPVQNILIRNFRIRTLDDQSKQLRVFFHHDLHIYGDTQKDTAFYEPYTHSVIHYRQSRYFLIGGETSDPIACTISRNLTEMESILHSKEKILACGIGSYSIGKSNYMGFEETWRDAEDGILSNTTVDQGSVDSTIGIHCTVSPDRETTVTQWLCLGKTLDEVVDLQQFILKESQEHLQRNCTNYWKSWVNKSSLRFGSLDGEIADLFKRSLLTIRLHADNRGGILAAADADIMQFNRDTYTYVWPRDGAFTCLALEEAGYREATRRFFEFCARNRTPDGYLLHKYNPDGSVGSTWHPWFQGGKAQLPIQEDGTGLVLVALLRHFEIVQDFEFLQKMYEGLVKRAGQFMVDFREPQTGLPLPSYDPWEEHRGIFTYTTACVIAGLYAASRISHVLGHYTHAERYEDAGDEMKQALLFHLYDDESRRFLKMIRREDGRTVHRDTTPDASIAAVWKLGILHADDPRMVNTMEQLREHLTVRTSIGGIARYPGDHYHRKTEVSPDIPGNPWLITTLWNAQWQIDRARGVRDLEEPRRTLGWIAQHASEAGMLAEQLHPLSGEPLSVSPLVWSHATFVETVLQFTRKERALAEAGNS